MNLFQRSPCTLIEDEKEVHLFRRTIRRRVEKSLAEIVSIYKYEGLRLSKFS